MMSPAAVFGARTTRRDSSQSLVSRSMAAQQAEQIFKKKVQNSKQVEDFFIELEAQEFPEAIVRENYPEAVQRWELLGKTQTIRWELWHPFLLRRQALSAERLLPTGAHCGQVLEASRWAKVESGKVVRRLAGMAAWDEICPPFMLFVAVALTSYLFPFAYWPSTFAFTLYLFPLTLSLYLLPPY